MPKDTAKRVGMIDEIRGIAILLMVVYHTFFDLVVLFGLDLPIFFSPAMNVIRDLFAGLFIFISGTACRLSRSNLNRGVLCFSFGMIMTYATALVMPEEQILFGILHLLGVCMVLCSFILPLLDKVNLWIGILVCALLFWLTVDITRGYIGLPGGLGWSFTVGDLGNGLLFPFGLPGAGFASSDYFPLLPWMFVFFAGTFLAGWWLTAGFPVLVTGPIAAPGVCRAQYPLDLPVPPAGDLWGSLGYLSIGIIMRKAEQPHREPVRLF